jgi:ankyrin repeat protein
MVDLLIEHACDVDVEDEEGGSVLQLAARAGYHTIVASLLSANAEPSTPNRVIRYPLLLHTLDAPNNQTTITYYRMAIQHCILLCNMVVMHALLHCCMLERM